MRNGHHMLGKDSKPPCLSPLAFYDATTLYVMFLEHRIQVFQGAFHIDQDFVTWYGYAELKKDLVAIRHQTEAMKLRASCC